MVLFKRPAEYFSSFLTRSDKALRSLFLSRSEQIEKTVLILFFLAVLPGSFLLFKALPFSSVGRMILCWFLALIPALTLIRFSINLRLAGAYKIIAALLVFAGAEIGLEIGPYRDRLPFDLFGTSFERHPYLFWIPKQPAPVGVRPLESDGLDSKFEFPFRSGRAPFEKSKGTRRVITLGGSSAFGDGLEYDRTFTARLSDDLKNDGIKNVETLCAAVQGYNLFQVLVLYKLSVRFYDPDLVVLYCNNIDGDEVPMGPMTYRDLFRLRSGVDISRLWIDEFEFPKNRDYLQRVRYSIEGMALYRILLMGALTARQTDFTPSAFKETNPTVDYEANLRDLIAMVQKDGARIILADEYQMTDFMADTHSYYRRYDIHNRMLAASRDTNSPFVPIHEDFHRRFRPEDVLMPDHQSHLNAKGHEELAKLIEDCIRANRLVQ